MFFFLNGNIEVSLPIFYLYNIATAHLEDSRTMRDVFGQRKSISYSGYANVYYTQLLALNDSNIKWTILQFKHVWKFQYYNLNMFEDSNIKWTILQFKHAWKVTATPIRSMKYILARNIFFFSGQKRQVLNLQHKSILKWF